MTNATRLEQFKKFHLLGGEVVCAPLGLGELLEVPGVSGVGELGHDGGSQPPRLHILPVQGQEYPVDNA